MTKQELLSYICASPSNLNPNILGPMIDGLTSANEDKVVLPDVEGAKFAKAKDIAKGKQALVLVNGEWTLITGTKEYK